MNERATPSQFVHSQGITPYHEVERMVGEFEAVLGQHGISIPTGSLLEAELLSVKQLLDVHSSGNQSARSDDVREPLQNAVSAYCFMRLVLRRANRTGGLDPFRKHLKLLQKGSIRMSARSELTDDANNKLFELYLGLCVADSADEVLLDDPENARGDNPDVLATISGKRWGFACKAVHSKNVSTIWDRIADGFEQLQRAEPDYGVVVITLKNRLMLEEWLPRVASDPSASGEPTYGVYTSVDGVRDRLGQETLRIHRELREFVGEEGLKAFLSKRIALPIVLYVVEIAVPVLLGGVPAPTRVGILVVGRLVDGVPFAPEAASVLDRINNAYHAVVSHEAP